MFKKLTLITASLLGIIALLPLAAGFEAHVINVTAQVENALFVHPESLEFGTVFPQEYFESSFFVGFSQSFSSATQRRDRGVEYRLAQKPKPRPEKITELGGTLAARDWCHANIPDPLGKTYDPNDPAWTAYLVNCYPTLCPYLSKHETTTDGSETNNDVNLPAFHNPDTDFATGRLLKYQPNFTTVNNDPADIWTLDLPVPCFREQCAQDWADFVKKHNPAANAEDYKAPRGLSGQVFGCDVWVEVTKIF